MTIGQSILYKLSLFCITSCFSHCLCAQQLEVLSQGTKTSLRGLSAPTDNIVWVSGSGGMVGRSVDAGKTWQWQQVPGYEKREFRDIEAFDENTAIILAIAEPGAILRTTDGGKNWTPVFQDSTRGIFFDAFHFNGKQGYLIGDPIDKKVYLAGSNDEGQTWARVNNAPVADSGEACFASSGTNIITINDDEYAFVTGGLKSRLYYKDLITTLPLVQGKESTGANSIAWYQNKAVIVGGDFARDSLTTGNIALVSFKPKLSITAAEQSPKGYRSAVTYIDANHLITCGTSGVDISDDGGRRWRLISREAFHVCQKAKKGNTVYLAGPNGKIAKYVP